LTVSAQNYVLDKTIPLTGNGGYDYLTYDAGRLYVSHGTKVDVVDVQTGAPVGSVEGMQGIHGIALAPALHRGFISDGKGNAVVVFDLGTLQTIKTISITGKDPDCILYDDHTQRVFAFGGDSKDASVIDAKTLTQVGTVPLGGGPEFAVSDGRGLIYNNLEDENLVNVIDANRMKVLRTYPLSPCGGPTGIALDKVHQRLFTVCRKNKGMTVVDAVSGKVITTVPIGAGVDAVVYDAATGLVYCSNGDGTATIIQQKSADDYAVVQTLTTQFRAKTMALDPATKKLYFSCYDMQQDKKTRVPDSFKVLVYTRR
jgi:DNA-binding beta-propeller fold protein YncE